MRSVPEPDLVKLARGGTINVLGGMLGAVAGMAFVLVLTNRLGADASGSLFRAIAVFNIATVAATLGVDAALTRTMAARRALGDVGTPTALLKMASVATLSAGIGLGGIGFAVADRPGRVLALFLPPTVLGVVALGATRGLGTMVPTVLAERLGKPVLQLLFVAVFVATGSTAERAAWWWGLAGTIAAGAAWWFLLRLGPARTAATTTTTTTDRREFWRFARARAGAALARAGVSWLDVVLVGVMISPAAAARYTAATRLVQAAVVIVDGLGQAVEPAFAAALARGDHDRAAALYRAATAWTMLGTWPWLWLTLVLSKPLLAAFGTGFSEASTAVAILAVSALIGAGSGPIDVLLAAAGHAGRSLQITLVALVVNVVANLALIPSLGIEGAAIAWALSRIVTNVLPLLQVRSTLGIHPFAAPWWAAAATSSVVFGLGSALTRGTIGDGQLSLLVVAILGTVLYGGLVWLARHRLELRVLRHLPRGH